VQALHHIAGTDGGIYIATNRAVYYRNNQTQFQLDNSGLPLFTSGNIFQPFYRDGKIRLASYGKGIWESNLNEAPSFPIARAMVDKLSQEVVCAIDSFYFEDHSFLNHSNASWNWTFPTGFPNSSTQRNPSVLFTEAGSHIAILQITDGNGNTDSDTIQVTVNNFTLSSNAGGFGATSQSTIFDNYNNDSQGNADDLIMYLEPSSILTNSYLKFDVAYARWGAGYSDTLEVLVSTDCGSIYQSLYLKGGTDLATSPDFQEYFTPTSTQWRTDSLDLSSFSNEINLQIAFRNIGRYGNVIYLDNINIGNLATINDQENFAPIIYPNPVRAGENIAIELNGTYSIALIDQKGTIIKRETGNNKTHLLISPTLAQGMYNIQIKTETKIWNNPIVIVK
jgi:hypothetical protein